MLTFFRRALSSWVVLGFLGIVLAAIVITGVGTPGSLGDLSGASNGERIARVGDQSVGSNDINQRLQLQLANMREQQPGISMSALVKDGAVEDTLSALVDLRAMQAYGQSQGMYVSKRLIDAEIARIDMFKGPTGAFDRTRFEGFLDQRNMTEAQLRGDIEREIYARMLRGPAGAGARPALKLVTPYASLMLEARKGSIAIIPSSAAGVGAQPTQQELTKFYTDNKARYTVPETRTVRYALFDRSRFEGKVAPTEAEIAAYFNKNAAKYAGQEKRALTQVIVQDQASANSIAAKIKAGGDMNAAAKSAGVEALKLDLQDRKAFASASSTAVADSVFKAAKSSVTGPIKSGLGWHIVRVDAIDTVAATSLAAARSGIVTELAKDKVSEALANFVADIDDAVADGQTFDEVVKAKGLAIISTPAITASGQSPENPGFTPTPEMLPILKDAFQAEPEDDPVVLSVGEEKFAFFDLDRVVPSAPRPLAAIAPQVARDFILDRASREARRMADGIAAKTSAGTELSAAVAATGKGLRAPQPISARRIDIVQGGERVPPALALMFSMTSGQAKVLEAPDKQGWFVVWLDSITPGKAESEPQLIAAAQQQLSQTAGQEFAQQFTNAIKAELKVSTDKDALARLRKSLTGAGAQ